MTMGVRTESTDYLQQYTLLLLWI